MNVLVLDGNENQAVAATRALNASGHAVVVGAETSWSKAGWSRSASGTLHYPSPESHVAGFITCLAARCTALGGAVVLPMTERSMLPVSEHRAALAAAGGTLVLPSHARVARACSKEQMTRLAATVGLTVPQTWTLGDDEPEAARLAGALPYPVVLKPAMSHEPVAGRMRTTGAPLYARHATEFMTHWRTLLARTRTIVVQPFVEGTGAGYFALVRHGQVLVEFAHRRIRDVRPTGSGSAVRESVAVDPSLAVPSRALLDALGWHGVAMVEYRMTPDGRPVFLEINPRFWTSLPLAIAAGVDFPSLLVQMAAGERPPAQPAYRAGVRARWLVGDVQHLAQVVRGAPRGYPGVFPRRASTLRSFLTPTRGMVHDNFRWDDPLPELGDWLHFVARRLPAFVTRARGASIGISNVQGRTAHP